MTLPRLLISLLSPFLFSLVASSATGALQLTHLKHSQSKRALSLRTVFRDSALSGAISCSMTHAAVVPIDVIKTKMQTDAVLAGKSAYLAYREILRRYGGRALLQGMAATSSGYFLQGFCKFGFYDAIKTAIFRKISDPELISRCRLPVLLGSSALAEFIACWVLTPMEVTRIAMVMNAEQTTGTFATMRSIVMREGFRGLYKGLPFILLRQIPYTCAKLAGYEIISDYMKRINIQNGPMKDDTKLPPVAIHLMSGVVAGVLAAIVSQPADVLLSRYCGQSNSLSECVMIDGPGALIKAFKDLGLRQSFCGLQPRAVMIGSLTAMQFFIYEQTKAVVCNICPWNGMER